MAASGGNGGRHTRSVQAPRARRFPIRTGLVLLAGLTLAALAALLLMPDGSKPHFRLEETAFSALEGWETDDHAAALAAFQRSCKRLLPRQDTDSLGGDLQLAAKVADFREICTRALATGPEKARVLFETGLIPFRIRNGKEKTGLITGYYEPVMKGSRTRSARFATPIYARPPELVAVDLGDFREELRGQRIAGRVEGGRLVPFEDREAIEGGSLAGRRLEILYLDDPVDAFFLHIQGSGRVVLEEGPDSGKVIRLSYAGQNGHPYTAIGRELVARGALTLESVSMQTIRAWLAENPETASEVMNRNASYIFFTELEVDHPELGPPGAEGSLLTPQRSIAVDRTHHALGLPVWMGFENAAGNDRKSRLTVSQDTGGAIRGPVRADLFTGVGDEAADEAGVMRETGEMTLLLPIPLAERARRIEW